MPRNFNSNTANHDEWLTPPKILHSLGAFDLDPCSPHPDVRPWDTARQMYHADMDGLAQPWIGRVFCNPPYGKETFKWLDKLANHGNGIALVFARTDTIGFHAQIFDRANSILFIKGRLHFHTIDGKQGDAANAPSCLVAYGDNNTLALQKSGIAGALVNIKG